MTAAYVLGRMCAGGVGGAPNTREYRSPESLRLEWSHWRKHGALYEPDGGTRGLGEDVLSARVDSQEVPHASELFSKEVPEKPLPWQRQPPCLQSGEVIINGGCWRHLTNLKPPCADDEYEWKNACYIVVPERARPPTTEKSQ